MDGARTLLVLVSRAERSAFREAERTRRELSALGVHRLELVINGIFGASDPGDPIATAMQRRGEEALAAMPTALRALSRTELPLFPFGLVGASALRS